MDLMKPSFKSFSEERKAINFKIPASWLPHIKKLAKIYGMPYSYLLRDLVGNMLKDYKLIK